MFPNKVFILLLNYYQETLIFVVHGKKANFLPPASTNFKVFQNV